MSRLSMLGREWRLARRPVHHSTGTQLYVFFTSENPHASITLSRDNLQRLAVTRGYPS